MASIVCSGPIQGAAALPKLRKHRATGHGLKATAITRRTARSAILSATPERLGAGWPGSARGWRRASISDVGRPEPFGDRYSAGAAIGDHRPDPDRLHRLRRQGAVDLGERRGARFRQRQSRRDTGFGLATAGYNARLDGVLSEVSYYWTRDRAASCRRRRSNMSRRGPGRCRNRRPRSGGGDRRHRAARAPVDRRGGRPYWIFDGKIFDVSGYGKFVDNLVQNFSDITVSQGVQSITFQGIGESRYGADAGASASLSLPIPHGSMSTTTQITRGDAVASGHAGTGVEVVAAGSCLRESAMKRVALLRRTEHHGRTSGPRSSSASLTCCAASRERVGAPKPGRP